MPWLRTPDGGAVHVRMGHRRSEKCTCGQRAPLQCDWPVEGRKSGTCDKPICEGCARKDGEKDYCPFHRGEPPKTQAELDLAGEDAADEAARILGVTRTPG